MRILLVTIGTLFISFICFWIVKFWGLSQTYNDFKHPMYSQELQQDLPAIQFIKPTFGNLETEIKSEKNLYLDVAVTQDQKLVAPKRRWLSGEKPLRYLNSGDILKDIVVLENFKTDLKNKKIIFNIIENTQAVHENFVYNMQKMGLEKGFNFIVTSPYEAPIKALKEIAPAYIYGSTQPEILKIIAMQSMYVLEAANIRADMIIHPLKIKNQDFFNEALVNEMIRRHKRIIVGPIPSSEIEKAIKLKPYGLIIDNN